ncbi:uncharacterized protein LOC126706994 [Quercus robur]|uniref:uncharacterized protein LOC126706994 n=1 Tax=Quercus robur TaxID=38942 RepID=UPI0021624A82|nr:uncharacterized protein LOC126706994 [Quercus robur]
MRVDGLLRQRSIIQGALQVPDLILPPVAPQPPSDLGLKVNPDLKKKRPVETLEEGEVDPRPSKQPKTTREQKDKRAPFVESREDGDRAEVRVNPRTWSLKLKVDEVAIPYTASVREYNRDRAGYIAEALEQLITQQVFVAEEYCRNNRKLAEAEEQFELSEKLKEAEKNRRSAEAGLKNAESQAEDQRQKLFVTETNLATEKQNMLDLKAALQKAKEEARLAKEEAQLVREAAEAEKKASYQLGAEETEARLFEELLEVCMDYCSISWAHALNAAGVPADSALRLPEKVFFPPEIREVPDEATEPATVVPDAIPLVDTTGGSGQVAIQVEDAVIEKKKDQSKGKNTSSKAKDPAKESFIEDLGADSQVKDVPPSQPEQKENPPAEA